MGLYIRGFGRFWYIYGVVYIRGFGRFWRIYTGLYIIIIIYIRCVIGQNYDKTLLKLLWEQRKSSPDYEKVLKFSRGAYRRPKTYKNALIVYFRAVRRENFWGIYTVYIRGFARFWYIYGVVYIRGLKISIYTLRGADVFFDPAGVGKF